VKRSANENDRSLADEILSYLVQHPEAQDTVEGIAEWWLLEQRIRHSVADVTAALAEFEAQKLVVTRRGVDGRIHYRVNPKKKQEICRRLNVKWAGRAARLEKRL
jgi:hypothetical protein